MDSLIMKNVLGVISADNWQLAINGTALKNTNQLQGGGTPSTQAANLASCELGGIQSLYCGFRFDDLNFPQPISQ